MSVRPKSATRKKQILGKGRKKTATMAVKRKGALIHWGADSGDDFMNPTSKFVEDKTWILNYEHQAVNFTDLCIKAGSKIMALAGLGDSDLKLRTSEAGLVRKYR